MTAQLRGGREFPRDCKKRLAGAGRAARCVSTALLSLAAYSCQSSAPASPAESPVPPATQRVQAEAPKLARVNCENPTLAHATLYAKPRAPVQEDVTIEVVDGVIANVSPSGSRPESGECVVDLDGRVVLAGFWNAHVHFTDLAFGDPESAPQLIREMLLRYGFTSVVDTGADPRVVHELRRAIRAGEMAGPRLIIAGGSFVAKDGTPSYLPKGLLPGLTTPAEAAPAVTAVLDAGADGIKIFSGSFQTPTHTIYLPPSIIAAVTSVAHQRGAFVVSHPTDRLGLVNAVDNGVDILAHTAPPAGVLEPELMRRMLDKKVALIPTLKLFRWELDRHSVPKAGVESYVQRGISQLREFHRFGGEVLFGTDVGYMKDYDTREEFELMARAGLDFHALLSTLTVNPAQRFSEVRGTVEPGEPADLVVLQGDPSEDVGALSQVVLTLREGRVVYQQ